MSDPAERRGGWPVTVGQGLQALLIAVPGVAMLVEGRLALVSTDKDVAGFAWVLLVLSCVPLLASVFGLYLAFSFRGGNTQARHGIVLYEATAVLIALGLAFLSAGPHFWSVKDQRSPGSIWSSNALRSPNHLWLLGVLFLGVFMLVGMLSPATRRRGGDGPPP